MTNWTQLASEDVLKKTVKALESNGLTIYVVNTSFDAKNKVSELIPQGAEVMNMSSVTLDQTGIATEIRESGRYNATKKKLLTMNPQTDGAEMRKMGAAPDWAIGSVHAVTQIGEVFIASLTGSQQPAYAYGAGHVVWVVGTQKVVADREAAFKRIYDYVLPLESVRANKAYNMMSGSSVNKILIVNKEITKDRISLIFVKEQLGF